MPLVSQSRATFKGNCGLGVRNIICVRPFCGVPKPNQWVVITAWVRLVGGYGALRHCLHGATGEGCHAGFDSVPRALDLRGAAGDSGLLPIGSGCSYLVV